MTTQHPICEVSSSNLNLNQSRILRSVFRYVVVKANRFLIELIDIFHFSWLFFARQEKIYDYCVSVLLCLRQYPLPSSHLSLVGPPSPTHILQFLRFILVTFKFLFPLCHKNVKTYFR